MAIALHKTSFPTLGVALTALGFAATPALWYLGDGRNDWWMCGVLNVYSMQWAHQTIKDFRAWRAHR